MGVQIAAEHGKMRGRFTLIRPHDIRIGRNGTKGIAFSVKSQPIIAHEQQLAGDFGIVGIYAVTGNQRPPHLAERQGAICLDVTVGGRNFRELGCDGRTLGHTIRPVGCIEVIGRVGD